MLCSWFDWPGEMRLRRCPDEEEEEPKETETDMEKGVKKVNRFPEGMERNDDVVGPGPRIKGRMEKMKRGTASHKTEGIERRIGLLY